jgi:hypothetical protein
MHECWLECMCLVSLFVGYRCRGEFPLPTAHFSRFFALMCTFVHLGAPWCTKMKKSRLVHKPHVSAQTHNAVFCGRNLNRLGSPV